MINERIFKLKKDGTPSSECFCKTPELIENYNKAIVDTTQVWDCHHRLETHNSDGERRLVDITKKELIILGMYFDRPVNELIFLTKADHTMLHKKGKKRGPQSEDHKRKNSEARRGKSHSNKGQHWKLIDGKRVYY